MPAKCSVILIREAAEQLTGSGCCGKLEGDNAVVVGRTLFAEAQDIKRQIGTLYRAVRTFFPEEEVELLQVDPRNQLYLIGKLWRDVWRYRPGLRAALRTLFQAFSLPAVIVNGHVLSHGRTLPSPDTLCHYIRTVLGPTPRPRHPARHNG